MNFLLAILGLLVFVLLNIVKAKQSHGKDFSAWIFIKDNQWTFYLSLASVVTLMLMLSDIIEMYAQFSQYIRSICALIGFTNYGLFKLIMDSLWKKKFKKDPPTIDMKP